MSVSRTILWSTLAEDRLLTLNISESDSSLSSLLALLMSTFWESLFWDPLNSLLDDCKELDKFPKISPEDTVDVRFPELQSACPCQQYIIDLVNINYFNKTSIIKENWYHQFLNPEESYMSSILNIFTQLPVWWSINRNLRKGHFTIRNITIIFSYWEYAR